MRSVLMMAVVLVGGGVAMAQVADRLTATTPAMAKPATPEIATGGRSVTLAPDRRGHFQTDVRIDGQRIAFMIDTGASVLALNESSAARIGIRPRDADYNANVATANGSVKAARTRIAMVEIGELIVRDVDALVLPDKALSENLLGLSFLSKLKRFAYAGGRMVLEQ